MATTFYSTANELAFQAGAYVRAKCVYTVTDYPDQVNVSGTMYLQHKGAAFNLAVFRVWASGGISENKIVGQFITSNLTSAAKHTDWTNVSSTTFAVTTTKSTSASTWYITVDAGGAPGLEGTQVSKAITISAITTYKITYKPNGASGSDQTQTKTYNVNATLKTSSAFTRSGYTFKRWNTNSTDTGTGYNSGATYTSNAALTLYAIWNRTVSYNANGGTGSISSQTAIATSAITLSSTKPTRTGYTFKNWNTASDGSGTAYSSGGSYAANKPTVTLYAQWTANTYTVSFNANGGVSAPASVKKTYGQSVTLPTAKPTRIGHTFLGWAATSSATTAKWAAGGSYSEAITANTTLYAVWRDDYTKPSISAISAVRCDQNGQEDDEGTFARIQATWSIDTTIDQNVTNNGTVTGVIKPENGSAASFSFSSGGSGTSGTAVALISDLDIDLQYTITVTVTDIKGSTSRNVLLLRAFYIIDFGHEGQAIGIGRAAPQSGLEVGYKATFDDTLSVLGNGYFSKNVYIGEGSSDTSASYGIVYRRYAPNQSSGMYNSHIIRVRPSADPANNGDPVLIGGGALMIIGGGEFATNYFNANPHEFGLTSEHMILGADGKVIVASNGGTIANAKEWEFSTNGNLICPETGNVRTQKGNIWIQRDDVLNTETSRSAAVYQNFAFKDKNDNHYGVLQGAAYTDGRKAVSLFARANDGTSNVDNSVALSVKPDGTRSVTVTSPLAWRNALGASSGIWPISLGGSGQSTPSLSTTVANIVTASSGFSIVSASAAVWGKVCTINIVMKTTNGIAAGNITNTTVATLKDDYKPRGNAMISSTGSGPVASGLIGTGGAVIIAATASAIAANGEFSMGGTYVLA